MTKKHFFALIILIAFVAVAAFVTKAYFRILGILMLAAALVYVIIVYVKFPAQQKPEARFEKEVTRKAEVSNQRLVPKRIPLGKVVTFLQYVIYGLIIMAVIKLLLGQIK